MKYSRYLGELINTKNTETSITRKIKHLKIIIIIYANEYEHSNSILILEIRECHTRNSVFKSSVNLIIKANFQ